MMNNIYYLFATLLLTRAFTQRWFNFTTVDVKACISNHTPHVYIVRSYPCHNLVTDLNNICQEKIYF